MKIYHVGARFALTVAVLLVVLMTGGCARTTINHSYGLGQNFTGLKNYKWGPTSVLLPSGQDSLDEENIQFIADQELKRKGYTKSSGRPDFGISIIYDYEIDRFPYSYQIRMLTLNVHRSENKELLWRGTAQGSINTDVASPELKQAVQAILSGFPDFALAVPKDLQLSELGFQSLQKGRYAEAEQYLEQALSANPNNPYAMLNLGAVYHNTGRTEMARKTYEKLITLNPPDVVVESNQSGAKGKSLVDIAKENLQQLK